MQGLYAVMTQNVRLCFPLERVQTQWPKPDVYDTVDRTLCVILSVLIFRHPPGSHTLVASSFMLQANI